MTLLLIMTILLLPVQLVFILAIEFSKAKLHTGWDTHIDGKTVKKSEEMRTQESGS